VHTECQSLLLQTLKRKAGQAQSMIANLVGELNNAMGISSRTYHTKKMEVPSWLYLVK